VKPFAEDPAPGRYEARIEELLGAEEYAAHRKLTRQWLSSHAVPLRTVDAGPRLFVTGADENLD